MNKPVEIKITCNEAGPNHNGLAYDHPFYTETGVYKYIEKGAYIKAIEVLKFINSESSAYREHVSDSFLKVRETLKELGEL